MVLHWFKCVRVDKYIEVSGVSGYVVSLAKKADHVWKLHKQDRLLTYYGLWNYGRDV